jgi:N-acyl-D-amino-acid deacylase
LSLDLLVENGLVVDGSGNPWYRANIAVKQDRLVAISRSEVKDVKQVVDANGLVVSPGFIDMHSHSDLVLLAGPDAESKIRQG